MRRFPLLLGLALLAVVTVLAGRPRSSEPDSFPHEKHAGLFPSCKPCHGILDGDGTALVSTTADVCARCHDGTTVRRVNWSGNVPRPSNLKFNHELHVKENGMECAACHEADGGGAERMAPKGRPKQEVCLTCHAAEGHFGADADCSLCHRPLSEARELTTDHVSGFPVPDNHTAADWWDTHGALAAKDGFRCSVCHARETCETCHLNAEALEPIRQLPRDPRVADQIAVISANWPRPADHDPKLWPDAHGAAALRDIGSCASCHVQQGCTGCHGPLDAAPDVVGRLPVAGATGPTGVQLPGRTPPGHTPEFKSQHGLAALMGNPRCGACHEEESFCNRCHEAPKTPEFHPPAYLNRHAADVYARDIECAACHSNEAFCRSCHENVGLSPTQTRNSSYHDAEPFWLLSHGHAARLGMESCASCHQQNDCLRCHSAKSGWRVSPHGPDFDAERMGDANPVLCARCHYTTPRP